MHNESGTAFAWMYMVDDSIVLDVGHHRAHALLIIAYYSILLVMEEKNFWYARGWAKQLVDQIDAQFDGQPKFLQLMEWPRHHVNSLCY